MPVPAEGLEELSGVCGLVCESLRFAFCPHIPSFWLGQAAQQQLDGYIPPEPPKPSHLHSQSPAPHIAPRSLSVLTAWGTGSLVSPLPGPEQAQMPHFPLLGAGHTPGPGGVTVEVSLCCRHTLRTASNYCLG